MPILLSRNQIPKPIRHLFISVAVDLGRAHLEDSRSLAPGIYTAMLRKTAGLISCVFPDREAHIDYPTIACLDDDVCVLS